MVRAGVWLVEANLKVTEDWVTFCRGLAKVHLVDDGTPSCFRGTQATQRLPLLYGVDGVFSHFGNREGGAVWSFVYVPAKNV